MKTYNKETDILFVLDISESMSGNKLGRVKADTIELVESLLNNEKNNVGLITFHTTSTIVSNFTNNKEELIEKINNLEGVGTTNYYQALVNVDTILKNYIPQNNRECIVLFLTDGYPNEDTPNEIGEYSYLKSNYPFITINAVQYEMGTDILKEIKTISDNQFIANMETLNNVLFDASAIPIEYDNFKIKDYIDTNYFYVNSESDIKVTQGKVSIDSKSGMISWIINNYKTGSKAEMTIKAKLKDNLENTDKIYPTNTKEEITSTIENIAESITSQKTPILADNFKVKYDGNAPSGCSVSGVPEEKNYSVFDTVMISDNIPVCNGYQFKGWKVITEDINMVNSEYFIMPESDVEIKGTWTKLGIKKSMNGTVEEGLTLYKQVQEDINDSSKYVAKYTGDTSTFKGNKDVYYYYGSAANNNVLFANYCWQIIRTTDTGGVKLLYNGVPSVDGKCNNKGENSQLTAEQMNTSTNKVAFNEGTKSLSDAGYMYNDSVDYSYKTVKASAIGMASYGNGFTYSDGMYTLQDTINVDAANYNDFKNNHYTCFNTTGVCQTLSYIYYTRYITGSTDRTIYYIDLEEGKSVEDALNEMLSVNKASSTIKTAIDYWYENNMTSYTKYLEDTVWCNDRSIYYLGGWNPNGGVHYNSGLGFKNYKKNNDLSCQNNSDRFTVNVENGNGALKYPVGLIGAEEQQIAWVSNISPFSQEWVDEGLNYFWSLSPFQFNEISHVDLLAVTNRTTSYEYFNKKGVRPAISLRSNIGYASGDGSVNSPYVIDVVPDAYNITIVGNDNVVSDVASAGARRNIKLSSVSDNYLVKSFKMNGVLIEGDSFIMPSEDVQITDIVLEECVIIESEHNPYPNSLNNKVYGEKTFSGAKSLTVELDYQTESISYDWIYLYDSTGKQYGKYGGSTRKTETITIPGDYIKIIFRTDSSSNNYYGFKATIKTNY